MRFFLSAILVFLSVVCFSQHANLAADSVVFDFPQVERVPEFKGGDTEMVKFLSSNLVYPNIAKEAGVQGIVYLTFVVEKDGTLSNIEVLKGVNVDYSKVKHEEEKEILKKAAQSLNEESIRVVKLMPPFIPGIRYKTEVRVKYLLPIQFKLQ